MGVPAFFRWLSRKYPSVVVYCVENKPVSVDGQAIPTDTTEPNPNDVEFDNLYLDMNGIIHPCTHPENKPAPRNEDEMMVAIFECIDRLFNIVRPRKLLYMAIDGVAPRAKMNQQRSRRFRAVKETVEKNREIARMREALLHKGATLPPEKPKEEHFDSNCITPGTPFMHRLSKCLHYFIHERINSDPGWKNIKVILSDANVPGEGEHKIMEYIRKQRAQPDHDPNTQHVLCGADADLIMLGLATHEPNFTIIREEFKPNQPRPCDLCQQMGHEMKDCEGIIGVPVLGEQERVYSDDNFIFVRLCVLREYLKRDLYMPNLPFKYEFERVVDDWVFMCFFVGNDFLPHLPSLEIREGAIDRLVNLYKDCVYKTGGYLTDNGDVNLERVQLIMSKLGEAEDEIFKRRQQQELAFKAKDKARKQRERQQKPHFNLITNTQFAPQAVNRMMPIQNARKEAYEIRRAGMQLEQEHLRSTDKRKFEALLEPEGQQDTRNQQNKRNNYGRNDNQRNSNTPGDDDEEDDQAHDEVRLWESGFKDRYYQSKFDVPSENVNFRYSVGLHYVRGLCWVLRYYYQGCASWGWYYPFHYAPFASDFVNIASLSTKFDDPSTPFQPFEQLMSVFPAASNTHVPVPWATLMDDPNSPIIDFYPEDFKVDLNGKKFAWQGVALLPFVDEKRLFKALKGCYDLLTPEEKFRNTLGDERLYVGPNNSGYTFLQSLYKNKIDEIEEVTTSIDGMQGLVLITTECVINGGVLPSPVIGLKPVIDNRVCTVKFRNLKYAHDFIFPARRLDGVIEPDAVLKPSDLDPAANRGWRPQLGMAPARQRAFVGDGGHRMLGHYAKPYQRNEYDNRRGGHHKSDYQSGPKPSGPYGAVPPPQMLQRNHNFGYSAVTSAPYSASSGSSRGGGANWRNYSSDTRNQGHNQGNYNPRGGYQNNQRGLGFDARNEPWNFANHRGGGNDNGRHRRDQQTRPFQRR